MLHATANAFHLPIHTSPGYQISALRGSNDENSAVTEAEILLAKAKAIRESLGPTDESTTTKSTPTNAIQSEFALSQSESASVNSFRLYLDIGRENGTWMDPRWGASGRRIECTLDISFNNDGDTAEPASADITEGLIKTVTSKSSSLSPIYKMQYASARLRSGFDKMTIADGGYCIESSKSASLSSSSTLRFCLKVAGTKDYGDVSIPEESLYFALPYFGKESSNGQMLLSNKEGTITVKQMGWHTGWRKEESRILGVFRAVMLEKAKARDKF